MGRRSDGWASSPEELELLLEDAVLLGDGSTVAALFASGAVLVDGPRVVGPERAMAAFTHLGYLATTRTVTHHRDLAVTLGHQAANVSVRAHDGAWRLVATVLRARTAYDEMSADNRIRCHLLPPGSVLGHRPLAMAGSRLRTHHVDGAARR